MAKYVIETFPQDEYTFKMYHNTGKKTWQKIQEETGCYAIINTAYFSMTTFAVESNTMIAGKWLFGPTYHEYGLCVDPAGRLTVGTEKEAVYDYTVGLPPCYISGQKYSAYKEHGVNGASFVGVARNGDVTCLIADKSNGMNTAQCCRELLDAGCVDIFRFDGSWSSQGTLGPDKDLDPAVERKVAVYLLIFKKNTTPEKKETLSNGIEIKTNLANKKNYGSSRSTSAIKYIVLHYTANDGDTDESNGKYFANTVTQTSAHYFVDSDSVTRSVQDDFVAWAVGGAKYADCAKTGGGTLYGKCTNSNSLSIELCDDVKNGTIKPSQKTSDNAIVLCKYLMKKYNVPPENVVRHFDVNGKYCPKFWMDDDTWNKEFWTKIGGVVAEDELTDIEWVQAELNERYDARLTVDGSWGPLSKKAMIKAIQTELNLLYKACLAVDGSFGPASQTKFPDIKSVTKNNLAWLIQACLVIKGYGIECDGSYGPGTAAIIKEFQKKNGLTVDSICGKNTMLKLLG